MKDNTAKSVWDRAHSAYYRLHNLVIGEVRGAHFRHEHPAPHEYRLPRKRLAEIDEASGDFQRAMNEALYAFGRLQRAVTGEKRTK